MKRIDLTAERSVTPPRATPKLPLPVRIGQGVAFAIVALIALVIALAIVALCLTALNGVLDTLLEELHQLVS